MQLKIELLVILFVFLILIVWALWYRITNWINVRRYKEKDDKSRYGEDERRRDILTEESSNAVGKPVIPDSKPRSVEGRSNIPSPSSKPVGEDIKSVRKTWRNAFRRR